MNRPTPADRRRPIRERRSGSRTPAPLIPSFLFTVALAVAAGCGSTGSDAPSTEASQAGGRLQSETVNDTASIEVGSPTTLSAPGDLDSAEVAPDDGVDRFSIVAQAKQPLVSVRQAPADDAALVAELAHPAASGAPLVFRVVDGGASTAGWLHVQLPIEPNGSTGWIRRETVSLSENPYRIRIDRASFSLEVFHEGRLWLSTMIAVGTGETPTPVGEFYLRELLEPSDPGGAYGPYAFGLSGFSEVLDSFGGNDQAIIGIHGTNDPSAIGTTVSSGCIRVENAIIEQMAAVVPLGTPVEVT